jgi:CBS domain-containing protein
MTPVDAGSATGTLLALTTGMRTVKVVEVMTPRVVSIRDDATLTNVDWEMTLAEVRHVPVVDDKGVVVGMVSDRDILRSLGRADRSLTPVSTVMSLMPVTVGPETTARDALEIMLARKINAVPVVDERGRLVGIVTATDFLELAFRALSGLPVDAPRTEA